MAQVSYKVEKLQGSKNYATWKYAMKMLLIREKLWKAVEPALLENEQVDKDLDQQALAAIVLNVQPCIYVRTKTATTAREAWTRLEKAFESSGLRRQIALDRQLYSTKYSDFNKMEDYINAMLEIQSELRGVGRDVTDEYMAFKLLANLPDSFDSLVMAIENSAQKLVLDNVIESLLQEESRRGENQKSDTALASKPVKRELRCFICDKPGHFANNCRSRGTKRQAQKGQHQSRSFIARETSAKRHCQSEWYLDSGATRHMSSDKERFNNLNQSAPSILIETVDGTGVESKGIGNINLEVRLRGRNESIEVKNVLYVPGLKLNLLSVGQITDKGNEVIFSSGRCIIRDHRSKKIVAIGSRNPDGLFTLDTRKDAACLSILEVDRLWHHRLGHPSSASVRRLQNYNLVHGLPRSLGEVTCEDCVAGKQARTSFPKHKAKRAAEMLDLVHTDVCGPMEETSIGGARYFATFIDDKTRKTFVYFLKQKSELLSCFEVFKSLVENQTGRKIKVLRSDNGGEYTGKAMVDFLKRAGIRHQLTAPYTPEQNGVAERANRTIVEKARCLLHSANLKKPFWAEAVNTAVYLKNRSPTIAVSDKTPEEAWSGEKPTVSHLRVFGSTVYIHVPSARRRKLDSKTRKCIFLGYEENSKAYRCFDERKKEVVISRNAVFTENEIISSSTKVEGRPPTAEDSDREIYISLEQPQVENNPEVEEGEAEASEVEVIQPEDEDEPEEEIGEAATASPDQSAASDQEEEHPPDPPNRARRSGRRKPKYLKDYVCLVNHEENHEPADLEEALTGANAQKWSKAIQEEMKSHEMNRTWEAVERLPKGRKPIKCKWVFKIKKGADGQINKYKARLVAKGCSQREGIDYQETFSPVVRQDTLKALLAVATQQDLEIDSMDVVTAYLNSELEEEIYMELPRTNPAQGQRFCRLRKALYGLKQSGRAWNRKLHAELLKQNLVQSKVDPCVYFKNNQQEMLIVAVYVDDLLIFSKTRKEMDRFKENLGKIFPMKDLGPVHECLGLRIRRNRKKGILEIDQEFYTEEILKTFNMQNCHPTSMPLKAGQRLDKSMCPRTESERSRMKRVPYREAIGKLLYLSQGTRPDITFAVNAVSQFSSDPGEAHWSAVKGILKYLRGTSGRKLIFQKSISTDIAGFCDADWANDVNDRKSIAGYAFKLGKSFIAWSCKKQPTVALSTTEAEYMSIGHAVKEALWLQQFFAELNSNLNLKLYYRPIVIYCDNRGAIELTKNNLHHARTKHIDVRHHFVRDTVESGRVKIEQVPTEKMVADIFTKPLQRAKLDWCVEEMNLR